MIRIRALILSIVAAGCSSASPAPDAAPQTCESQGYLTPTGTSCPKGTCMASDISMACCGSVCATCEDKGLVSFTEAGVCPPGLCASNDVTVSLQCCDVPGAGENLCTAATDASSGPADAASETGQATDGGAD